MDYSRLFGETVEGKWGLTLGDITPLTNSCVTVHVQM